MKAKPKPKLMTPEEYLFDWLVRGGHTLADVKRATVLAALRLTGGNRTAAARRLGVSIRGMRYLANRYELRHQAPEATQ